MSERDGERRAVAWIETLEQRGTYEADAIADTLRNLIAENAALQRELQASRQLVLEMRAECQTFHASRQERDRLRAEVARLREARLECGHPVPEYTAHYCGKCGTTVDVAHRALAGEPTTEEPGDGARG